MKNVITIFMLCISFAVHAQSHEAFEDGEWFKFRIHYGIFNASFATLEVNETTYKNKPVYHVVGKGKSTGLLDLFFNVNDNYETYIDKNTGAPYKFIRKINEGGYTKDIQIEFDHDNNTALVVDKEHNEREVYSIKNNVHDMVSAFYYLRNNLKIDDLQQGEMLSLNMFFDNKNHNFKIKFLGRDVIETKFGKMATLKFRPYVLAGRVFEEKESLTFWISDDANRIPVKIEADLAVGSLDADLYAFKGLKHSMKIIMD